MAFSRFPLSRVTSSNLFFTKLLRLNRPIPVVPPFAATDRLYHDTMSIPGIDSNEEISGDHLRSTFKTFRFLENPYQNQGPKEPCDLKEDENALLARVDMPGVSKEGLKLWYENGSLYITGEEGEKDDAFVPEFKLGLPVFFELPSRLFSTSLAVSPQRFKMDQIKAKLKNGILWVVIPKRKRIELNNDVVVRVEIE